jgi:UDP-N-acetylmuramyl pentapeptide phosphotransferase/UDP-N-acetylglucosamine-1-phosphate transferase
LHESDLNGVQKFHTSLVPRVGGVAVFISFFLGLWFSPLSAHGNIFILLLIASFPVFLGGMLEDLTAKISPLTRSVFILASISIAFIFLDIKIDFLGFELFDLFLSNYLIINLLFTLFVVSGVVNAINIIDGYNGLMIGYSILVLLAISYVANILGDSIVLQLSLLLASSLFGLFVLNFPFGKIFMGDGGAYFVGFMMAVIGIMFGIRNDEVSHWFILLLLIYPLYETVFSIYRKKFIRGISPSQPDGHHLHMLIYKRLIKRKVFKKNRVLCNSMVSPFFWLLSLVGIIPAIIWFDNQIILILWSFVFMVIYTIIYRRIVHFKFKFKR